MNQEELLKEYNNLQKIYFLKCKELSNLENHIQQFKTEIEIQRKRELKAKRIKLRNSISILKN